MSAHILLPLGSLTIALQERDDIINRFRDKKRRRVWKKKIRYHCRKNLADRRVRVKGRFVRRELDSTSPSGEPGQDVDDEDESDDPGGDAVISSSSADGATSEELGSKRRRHEAELAANTKHTSKRTKRVIFDSSVAGASSSATSGISSVSVHSASSVIISDSPSTEIGSPGHPDEDLGKKRMRRHSIAY